MGVVFEKMSASIAIRYRVIGAAKQKSDFVSHQHLGNTH